MFMCKCANRRVWPIVHDINNYTVYILFNTKLYELHIAIPTYNLICW